MYGTNPWGLKVGHWSTDLVGLIAIDITQPDEGCLRVAAFTIMLSMKLVYSDELNLEIWISLFTLSGLLLARPYPLMEFLKVTIFSYGFYLRPFYKHDLTLFLAWINNRL